VIAGARVDGSEPVPRIAIVIGSTRPGGKAKCVGEWAYDVARHRDDADFQLLDIAIFGLPLLDEPEPAMLLDAFEKARYSCRPRGTSKA
jgi:NADPH-dependent FMN reductase